jgi:hypothetical protein
MAKDDAETEPHAFILSPVGLGKDLDGEDATSCTIDDGGAAPGAISRKKRGRPSAEDSDEAILAELIYRELCNLLADSTEGQKVKITPLLPEKRAITRTKLRETVIRAGILVSAEVGEDPKTIADSNRWKMNRALNRLKKRARVLLSAEWIALP